MGKENKTMSQPKQLKQIKYKNLTYSIDNRLKEFRCYNYPYIVIHHSFNSTEGKKILKELKHD